MHDPIIMPRGALPLDHSHPGSYGDWARFTLAGHVDVLLCGCLWGRSVGVGDSSIPAVDVTLCYGLNWAVMRKRQLFTDWSVMVTWTWAICYHAYGAEIMQSTKLCEAFFKACYKSNVYVTLWSLAEPSTCHVFTSFCVSISTGRRTKVFSTCIMLDA